MTLGCFIFLEKKVKEMYLIQEIYYNQMGILTSFLALNLQSKQTNKNAWNYVWHYVSGSHWTCTNVRKCQTRIHYWHPSRRSNLFWLLAMHWGSQTLVTRRNLCGVYTLIIFFSWYLCYILGLIISCISENNSYYCLIFEANCYGELAFNLLCSPLVEQESQNHQV